MATLHSIYQLMCSDITIHKGYKIQPYTMKENEFYSRIFSSDLKENFASLLNYGHHSFQANSFTALTYKENRSKKHRAAITAYFMGQPSAVETLLHNSQAYLAKETPAISWDQYITHMKRWIQQLPLKENDPLRTYLLDSCSNLLQYPIPMTWMILDAFSISANDISSLYGKYSSWSSGCSSASYLPLLKITNNLRQLHTHARKSLNDKWGNQTVHYSDLNQEFHRLEAIYEQNALIIPSKNFQPLLMESLKNFRHFLTDYKRGSFYSAQYLHLMQNNVEKLEELLSKYP